MLNDRLAPIKAGMDDDAPFASLCHAAFFQRVDLTAHGHYKCDISGFDFDKQVGRPFHYFSYGAAAAEVEIDTLTGDHHVVKVWVVHDVGKSLNPAIDIGQVCHWLSEPRLRALWQVEGAFVQGMGYMTIEEPAWAPAGTRGEGHSMSVGPGKYKIPSFNDIPLEFSVKLLENSKQPSVVHSSKGVGEPPLFLGSSVFLAIRDAVGAARRDAGAEGFFRLDVPASAERIRMACADQFTRKFVADNFVPNVSC
jgi:xanthine dehydrogenase/oxidase